jgi:hypothetical protein
MAGPRNVHEDNTPTVYSDDKTKTLTEKLSKYVSLLTLYLKVKLINRRLSYLVTHGLQNSITV